MFGFFCIMSERQGTMPRDENALEPKRSDGRRCDRLTMLKEEKEAQEQAVTGGNKAGAASCRQLLLISRWRPHKRWATAQAVVVAGLVDLAPSQSREPQQPRAGKRQERTKGGPPGRRSFGLKRLRTCAVPPNH